MSSKEIDYKSQLTGTVDSFIVGKKKQSAEAKGLVEGDVEFLNILDYIEKFNLLPFGLYPVQRFIVKMYYNIPLDNTEKNIKITDKFGVKIIHEFTEVEYLRYLYSQGRCNISEQDGRERREIILLLGRRSGKCLRGDSLVLTDKGILRIDSLGDPNGSEWQDINPIIVAQEGKETRAISSKFYNPGVQNTFEFTTDSGFSECGTGSHRIKVMGDSGSIEWKKLSDLNIGDYVAIHPNTNLWAKNYINIIEFKGPDTPKDIPDKFDEDLSEILGFITGGWSRFITKNRKKFPNHLEERAKLILGDWFYKKLSRNSDLSIDDRISKISTPYSSILGFLGFCPTLRNEILIPWCVFQSPRSVVSAFLRGLFEACSLINETNIRINSYSNEYLKQLQILLLNFGVVSTLKLKEESFFNSYILISDLKSLENFQKNIGFILDEKKQSLLSLISKAKLSLIPNQTSHLKLLLSSINDDPSNDKIEKYKSKIRKILRCKKSIDSNLLEEFVNEGREIISSSAILDEFSNLLSAGYYWDKVVSIKDGVHPVYDLNVPEGESFVANGFTNHNSALASIFASYELYKLICRGNPQSYYGMPAGSEIRVLCIANDKEQASIVFGDVQAHIESIDYFKNSVAAQTQTFIRLRTEGDKKKFGDNGKSTIVAAFKSSIAKGLRGRGVMCSILDEIAFFVDTGKSSGEKIYKAIAPSLAQFSKKDKGNRHKPIGDSEGRMILISSPDSKEGFLYDTYQMAMSNSAGAVGTIVIQAPTWEVNPTISEEYYRKEYHKDPRSFMTEHGAEFSDRVRGWIEDENDLLECVQKDLRPKRTGYPREAHFAGLDFGLVGDGTAISIVRFNDGKIELVYHEAWYAGKSWKESNPHLDSPLTPYCLTLENVTRLDIEEIAKWLKVITTKFYIQAGTFDQWAGPAIEQILHNQGLTQFEMRNFTTNDSSNMYKNLKIFLYNRQIAIYDYPVPESFVGDNKKHSPLISELLELQAESGGKNIIIVEAPKTKDKHDDVSDSFARAVLLATEYLQKHPQAINSKGYNNSRALSNAINVGYKQYHRQRNSIHGSNKMRRPNKSRLIR